MSFEEFHRMLVYISNVYAIVGLVILGMVILGRLLVKEDSDERVQLKWHQWANLCINVVFAWPVLIYLKHKDGK